MSLITALSLASCKKATEEGYVESGELVVIQDFSDINLGIYGIDTLNPLATKSKSVQKIMNIVYEPLFTMDEMGKPDPMLAHSYTVSNGGKRIEITLKSGVKWHDGTNFTAEDVTYTLSRMGEEQGLYGKIYSKIHSFTAVDKDTVIIDFVSAEPAPECLLTFPIISRQAAYSQGPDYTPVGTGGYKFVSKSGTDIVLEPNSLWHEGAVSERKIMVKILKDKNATAEAFNVGELDAITSDELDGEKITPKTNSQTQTMTSNKMVFLGFNVLSPVVASQSVRKAIDGVLDREKMVEQDAYGRGVAARLSIDPTSWFATGFTEEERSDSYSEDLMEDEGYVMKDGVYHKDDIRLTIKLLVNADNTQRTALAESIANSLKNTGFDVVLEKTSYEEYTAKIAGDDFDMFIGETEVSGNPNPMAMLTGADNYFNYDTSRTGSFYTRLCTFTDMEEMKTQIGQFGQMLCNDPPYLPLYFKTENVIYGSYVSGIVKPVSFDPYKDIEKWYFYDKDGKENKEQADE